MQVEVCNEVASWQIGLSNYGYSLFMTPEWVESIVKEGRKSIYINFILDHEIIAKLAGVEFESKAVYKRKLYFHTGPALKSGESEEKLSQCIRSLISFARQNEYGRVVMLSYDYKTQIKNKHEVHFSKRCEYVVDLCPSNDEIKNAISSEIKRSFKKALKEGFTIREINTVEMAEQLINLLHITKSIRISKGYHDYDPFYLPLFDRKMLIQLIIHKAVRIFAISLDDEVFAINAIMVREKKAYGLLLGVTTKGYQYKIPSFLSYLLIMRLKNEGYEYYNLGGVSLDETHNGLRYFKESLGGVPVYSSYGSTNFLLFPYNLLNPLMNIGRILPENKLVKLFQKKL